MRYLFAILLPPLAVLSCGKPFQALINLILTCFFWLPGAIHAMLVVNSYQSDKRFKSLEKTIIKVNTDTSRAPAPIRTQNRSNVEKSANSSIILNSKKVRIKP